MFALHFYSEMIYLLKKTAIFLKNDINSYLDMLFRGWNPAFGLPQIGRKSRK